jgi:hypothetical protein
MRKQQTVAPVGTEEFTEAWKFLEVLAEQQRLVN